VSQQKKSEKIQLNGANVASCFLRERYDHRSSGHVTGGGAARGNGSGQEDFRGRKGGIFADPGLRDCVRRELLTRGRGRAAWRRGQLVGERGEGKRSTSRTF